MRIFWKNTVKIASASLNPRLPPAARLGAEPLEPRFVTTTCYYNFVDFSYLALNAFHYPQKGINC